MATDDYNVRAAKGQAMNLAVMEAIHDGKLKSPKYIYSLYLKYYELGQFFQTATIAEVKEALK